ncbi:MAG: antibiotic biosynthesis monooxygenase [Fimbriimonadaceae bacterium]|nr:antibiotic biosynthesis monooxygenase [Fimbriimonadaceae bacterium]
MIVVANRILVAPGYEEAFEERFRRRAGLVDASPGFLRNLVLRPVPGGHSKAECYSVLTFWEDFASFEAWTQSDAFRQAHADRPPREMFSGPSTLEIHEVVSDSAAR